jgi:hypothetical protein
MPQDATPLEKSALTIELIGYEAAWGRPEISEIALQQLETSNERNLWSCDTVSRVNTFIVEREQLGEIGALRELRDRREPPASQ